MYIESFTVFPGKECEKDCQHYCVHEGNYEFCRCRPGYRLDDGTRCISQYKLLPYSTLCFDN